MAMTEEEIKIRKPEVTIMVDGREIRAPVLVTKRWAMYPDTKRRKIEVPVVMVNLNGERECIEFSWKAILEAVNEGKWLYG